VNKSGLVAEVAKRVDRNKADVARVLDTAMAVIRDTVTKGERVALVGFGTFERQRRNKRIARNPRRPDVPITIPARDVPAFSPGQAFRQAVLGKRRRATPRTSTAASASASKSASTKRSTGSATKRG
jgi:DNA-binding protein HU-beta